MECGSQWRQEHDDAAEPMPKVVNSDMLSLRLRGNTYSEKGNMFDPNTLYSDRNVTPTQKAEKHIKRMLSIGSVVGVPKLKHEMQRRNISERDVQRALSLMCQRGEIEYRARRRQVIRMK